VTKYPTLTAG